jgi:hypothetical protein
LIYLVLALAFAAVAAGAQESAAPPISGETPSDPALAKAMAAVNVKLKDPESARYGNMAKKTGPSVNGKPAEVVCGTVASKDASGRYGGTRWFVYFIADGAMFLTETRPQPEDVAQIIYARFCK